jgi:hypothetical protein
MPLEDWMEVLRKCFKSDQLRLDGKLPPRGKKREQELLKRLFGDDVDLDNSGSFHDAVIRYDIQDGKIEVKRDGKIELKIEFKEQLDVQWFDPSKYVGKYKYERSRRAKRSRRVTKRRLFLSLPARKVIAWIWCTR